MDPSLLHFSFLPSSSSPSPLSFPFPKECFLNPSKSSIIQICETDFFFFIFFANGCRTWLQLFLVPLRALWWLAYLMSTSSNTKIYWVRLFQLWIENACPQPVSHNQRGQENLEAANLLWFYNGKGLIFSHVRGKQNGKQMGNLGKMLHICRRK